MPAFDAHEHKYRLMLWQAGATDEVIAWARGYSRSAIAKWRRRHGLASQNPDPRGWAKRRLKGRRSA